MCETELKRNWTGTFPCDAQYREKYRVKEVPVDEAWEDAIIHNTDRATILKHMNGGDLNAGMCLNHLDRNEDKDDMVREDEGFQQPAKGKQIQIKGKKTPTRVKETPTRGKLIRKLRLRKLGSRNI
jgi:hypothetical protein